MNKLFLSFLFGIFLMNFIVAESFVIDVNQTINPEILVTQINETAQIVSNVSSLFLVKLISDSTIYYILEATGVAGNESRLIINSSLFGVNNLNDLTTISWDANVLGYLPHADVYLDLNEDGIYNSSVDDVLVFEYAKVNNTNCDNAPYPTGTLNTFADKGVLNDSSFAWLNSGDAGACGSPTFFSHSLLDWKSGQTENGKTINSSSKVLKIELEVDNWILDSHSEVINVLLNGNGVNFTLNPFEVLDLKSNSTIKVNQITPQCFAFDFPNENPVNYVFLAGNSNGFTFTKTSNYEITYCLSEYFEPQNFLVRFFDEITSTSSSSGGGSTGYVPRTSSTQINEGYSTSIVIGKKIFFKLGNENHDLSLFSIKDGIAKFGVHSESSQFEVEEGDTATINFKDYKLFFKLKKIEGNKAEIFLQNLKYYKEETKPSEPSTQKPSTQTPEEEVIKGVDEGKFKKGYIFLILGLIAIFCLVVFYVRKEDANNFHFQK